MEQRKLLLTSILSPGDAVMLTAAIRDLHLNHPFKYITGVNTSALEIWEHNPYISEFACDWENKENGTKEMIPVEKDVERIECHYPLVSDNNNRPYHFIHGYIQHLEQVLDIKIPITEFKGDIHLSEEEKSWMPQVEEDPINLKRRYWIICAGGKYDYTCLSKGSRIQTMSGYKRIEEVNKDDLVFTEYGYKKCDGSVFMGKKQCITLRTQISELTVSKNHKFRVFDGNKLIWKVAKNVGRGDLILGKYHNPSFIQQQSEDSDRWFALGFLWGDGFLRKKYGCSWIFTETDQKAKDRIISWLDSNGYNWHETIRRPEGQRTKYDFRITTGNAKFGSDLPSYSPKGTWRDFGFPDSYFNLGYDATKALLQGLFSSDGTIDKIGNISFTSKQKVVIRDVRRLLWKCGILSSISEHQFTSIFGKICRYHKLHILGKTSCQRFKDIGFCCPHKDDRLQKHRYKFDKLVGIKNASKIIESLQTKKDATKRARLLRTRKPANIRIDLRNHNFIAESIFPLLTEYFNSDNETWNEFLENKWYLTEVLETKDAGKCEVYDILNSETESFIAEGVVSHNCKWWNPTCYQHVVNYFGDKIQFVQVGQSHHWHPKLENVINLVGKTSTRELIRLVYHADGVLCGVTFLMHLAAAVETKEGRPKNRACVVVAGGREGANWEAYPQHQYIHTCGALPCCIDGGCWCSRCQLVGDGDRKDVERVCERPIQVAHDLRIPECMYMITPDDVIRRIEYHYASKDNLRYYQ